MRNWLKCIIFECLREIIKDQPLIISHRAPTSEDVYGIGTAWMHGKDVYRATKVNVQWTKENHEH